MEPIDRFTALVHLRSLPLQTLLLLEDGALLAALQGAPGQWAIWRIRIQLRVGRYLNNFYWRLTVFESKSVVTKYNNFNKRLWVSFTTGNLESLYSLQMQMMQWESDPCAFTQICPKSCDVSLFFVNVDDVKIEICKAAECLHLLLSKQRRCLDILSRDWRQSTLILTVW